MNTGRLTFIDGLKGLAALVVFMNHFCGSFHLPFPEFLQNGDFAVMLFLVLSGFSVSLSLRNKTEKQIQQSIVGRYFRFALPIFFVSTFCYILYLAGFYYNNLAGEVLENSWLQSFYCNITLKQYLSMCLFSPFGVCTLDAPLWVLKFFFIGFFLVVILKMAIAGLPPIRYVPLLLLVSLLCLKLSGYYSAIICGMLVECLFNDMTDKVKRIPGVVCLILGLVAVAVAQFPEYSFHPYIYNLLGSLALIILCLSSGKIQNVLSSRPFAFIGKINFELYLLHWPILCSFSCWFFLNFSTKLVLPNLALSLLIVGIASFLMNKYIQPQINRIQRKLIDFVLSIKNA